MFGFRLTALPAIATSAAILFPGPFPLLRGGAGKGSRQPLMEEVTETPVIECILSHDIKPLILSRHSRRNSIMAFLRLRKVLRILKALRKRKLRNPLIPSERVKLYGGRLMGVVILIS